jgi:hypothetical protein
MQAQFLIPMAISLAFGVMFATFIVLLLVPSLYFILEDLRHLGSKIRGGRVQDEDFVLPDLDESEPVV